MAAIGVHIGATCSCVAIYKDGRADVVANDAGDRVTPAVVAYRENEKIVGLAAKQGRIRNASNTIVKVKQILGRRFDDPQVQRHVTESKCSVIEKDGKPRYELDTGAERMIVPPEEVMKLIFAKMKETAQSALGSDANDVVITVPLDFGKNQKNILRQAAQAAGFNVLRLIHEPAAALLAFGVGQESSTEKSNALVYKLGGSSLSVTIVEVNSGMYRVLASHTDDSIGGECFTKALALYLASEFQRLFKHDVRSSMRAMMKLINSAEVAKHTLSTLGSSNCFLDSLHEGLDFDCSISRARFESVCSALFIQSVHPIQKLVEEAGLSRNEISKVVLCGGSARIPKLQQMIRDLFPDVDLLNSIPSDEVIAVGAAIEAALLLGKENSSLEEESVIVECSARNIVAKEIDESGSDTYKLVFPSGTPLPARKHHAFQAPGNVSSVCLELYESGEKGCDPERNKLAQIVLKDLQLKEDSNRDILTVLTMKRDGSLHVTCTEQGTGISEAITIDAAS
ncbi:heat shock 70 kDa protein 14 [Stegostoma tigrinum]|uniref:heat shock 70 kDa protein 14 n=1 Tax=Stegostoma tigrinum TaxID=3053191 RepID=UPI00202B3FEC|nr:heat shock 70 kDa protein 14 [Stegostoma tigrinum]